MSCVLKGYGLCHNPEEVIERIGYQADEDVENTADSVFCAHGAGFIVPWYEVEDHMHVQSGIKETAAGEKIDLTAPVRPVRQTIELTQEELDAIYVRTPDPVRRKMNSRPTTVTAERGTSAQSHSTREKRKSSADPQRHPRLRGRAAFFLKLLLELIQKICSCLLPADSLRSFFHSK